MTGRGRGQVSSTTTPQASSSSSRGGSRGGRGGGRGRGRGKGQRPPPDLATKQDLVKSRPEDLGTKQGTSGNKVQLSTNFFTMITKTNWVVYQYHVDFKPFEDKTDMKKKLLRNHQKSLGAYMFDGQVLYTVQRLSPDPQVLCSIREVTRQKVTIYIKFVSELAPTDVMHLQLYNIILRNALGMMKMEEIGRYFYDCDRAIPLTTKRLELWPGVITSIRNHENKVLLCVEITHKVLRSDNVLQVMHQLKQSSPQGYEVALAQELIGTIVMTTYNKKTYQIDDIRWDITPESTFEVKSSSSSKSYMDYYREQYGCFIKDKQQPLLVSLPKKKDFHRGSTGPIYLVPELCQMTGLTDDMRKDMNLMKEISGHLSLSPTKRVEAIRKFMERWKNTTDVQQEMKRWGITFDNSLADCPGRELPVEDIIIGPKQPVGSFPITEKNHNGDWSNVFKSKPMLSCIHLKCWAVVMPAKGEDVTNQLLNSLLTVSKCLNFPMNPPAVKLKANDNRPSSYVNLINILATQYKAKLQMIMFILPNNSADLYGAIKRRCYVDLGIPSQCVVSRTILTKNPGSVAQRIAIQLNAKIGGEPWSVSVPLQKLMCVGFDVYHSSSKNHASVGALVASLSDTFAKYFSTTSFHKSKNELSSNLCSDITKALYAYQKHNGILPSRIIFFRDGVGDGQLTYIYNVELQQILEAMNALYALFKITIPKFSFIIVTKRIHTRIFSPMYNEQFQNPRAGTIVDDVITLPERYDFFLVSQSCQVGTVSPTSYNVLYDRQGLGPDRIQRLTFKMCHVYFNYTGTIAVPAPCQFAHKLAYVAGTALTKPTHESMSTNLYYL